MAAPVITSQSTMAEILKAYPNADEALFSRYHIGGCSSCGYQQTDTLETVAANNNILDVDGFLAFLEESGTPVLK